MPTDDDRRDAESYLRNPSIKHAVVSGIDLSPILNGLQVIMTSPCESTMQEAANAIADLIEPEPERTCHRVWHSGTVRSDRAKCSECGYGITDRRFVYCPKCGAKIEEDS